MKPYECSCCGSTEFRIEVVNMVNKVVCPNCDRLQGEMLAV